MPSRLYVQVTQRNIDEGVPRNSGHCMIAEAVREQIPNASFVSVDLQTIRWTDRAIGRRYIAFTPPRAQQALVDWDKGVKQEPFRVRLAVVQTLKVRRGRGGDDAGAAARQDDPEGSGGGGQRRATVEPKRIAENQPGRAKQGRLPLVEGGKQPPTAALANRPGKRRVYGLRSLDR